MKQDLADKIAQQTAKKTAQAEQAAKKKIAKLESAAAKKTAAAEKRAEKQAINAGKKAAKAAARVAAAEKKAAAQVAKANKKAAAQKEKASKLEAKKKESAAPQEGGEAEGGKKKGKKKILLLLPIVAVVAAAGVFFFLRGRGDTDTEEPVEPIAPPAEFLFAEEEKIPALPVQGEEILVYVASIAPEAPAPQTEPEGGDAEGEEGEEGGDAEAEAEEVTPATQYTYENLQDPKGLLQAYASLMMAEDVGFSAVDEDFVRTDLPDFEGKAAADGQPAVPAATSVLLARNSGGDDSHIQSLLLSWSETGCTVTLDTAEGRVRDPAPAAGTMPSSPGLSVEGFRQLAPQKLGLPGSSLDEYNIYVQDGTILVAGNTCVRISVYSVNEATGSNEIAGSYFLSADGQHLYQYDVVNNSVVELEIEE